MDGYAVRAAELGNGPLPIAFRVAAGDAPQALPAGSASGIATGAPLPAGRRRGRADRGGRGGRRRAGGDGAAARRAHPPGRRRHRGGRPGGAGGHRALTVRGRGDRRIGRRRGAGERPAAGRRAGDRQRADAARRAARAGPDLRVEPGVDHGAGGPRRRRGDACTASSRTTARATERMLAEAIESARRRRLDRRRRVGPHDHVKPALAALGVEEVFWRVAHKPGKPLWFGRRAERDAGLRPAREPRVVPGHLRALRPRGAGRDDRRRSGARGPSPGWRRRCASSPPASTPSAAGCCRGPTGMELHPDNVQDSHLIVHAAAAPTRSRWCPPARATPTAGTLARVSASVGRLAGAADIPVMSDEQAAEPSRTQRRPSLSSPPV